MNNCVKHCLEFWRANHDIQLSLSPYAVIQYMLSYVTKTKKGMSAIMDRTCRDARQGKWLAAQGAAAGGLGQKGLAETTAHPFCNCVECNRVQIKINMEQHFKGITKVLILINLGLSQLTMDISSYMYVSFMLIIHPYLFSQEL